LGSRHWGADNWGSPKMFLEGFQELKDTYQAQCYLKLITLTYWMGDPSQESKPKE